MAALLAPVHNPYALPGLLFTSRIEAKIPPGWQTRSPMDLASWATALLCCVPAIQNYCKARSSSCSSSCLHAVHKPSAVWNTPSVSWCMSGVFSPFILHSDDPIFDNYSKLLPLPPFLSWRLTYLHENILPDLKIRYSCISLLNYKPLPDYLNPWDLVLDMTLHRNPWMSQWFQDPWSWNSTVSHTFMSHLVLIHQWCTNVGCATGTE